MNISFKQRLRRYLFILLGAFLLIWIYGEIVLSMEPHTYQAQYFLFFGAILLTLVLAVANLPILLPMENARLVLPCVVALVVIVVFGVSGIPIADILPLQLLFGLNAIVSSILEIKLMKKEE